MRRFDRIKTVQLVVLAALTAIAILIVFHDADLYRLIASDPAARNLSVVLWLTLGFSFLFLLYDFSSFADMRRENQELDNAVYSDALTGIANRYSVDVFIGQFLGKPLPEDMGAVTLDMTNLGEINKALGHSWGDLAIQAFSSILQNAAERSCFIGRNGGNKFVVIFRDCTDARIERFLDKVETLVRERNAAHPDAPLKYSTGTSFNEGGAAGSVTELIALSDRRAWENQSK